MAEMFVKRKDSDCDCWEVSAAYLKWWMSGRPLNECACPDYQRLPINGVLVQLRRRRPLFTLLHTHPALYASRARSYEPTGCPRQKPNRLRESFISAVISGRILCTPCAWFIKKQLNRVWLVKSYMYRIWRKIRSVERVLLGTETACRD